MAEALKKFGKYFLLDQIAQGGMAEIYRARMASADGGGRLLAIKKVIASFSANVEFVQMFKSEIKTTSGFTHPNIVQVYDYGEEQGMLYIAMELVDGRNLRQFISRFAELKQMFPVEVSVYILEQAAHGMAYAHGFKDKISGKSLNIVHRDISPQNLLISYDGAVKVIDFGIAKAVTNSEATKAGIIKGKPSYLSPEQISGETLDGRSDIFALGIVLWELLTGRKLFASDNDYGVLKLIENCTNHVKPPSLLNPKVPQELDSIVMKSLKKNRDERYQNAEELQRALHKCLYQSFPDFNPADLSYYAKDLFKNEIVEDRKRLLKLNEKAEQLLASGATDVEGPVAPAVPGAGGAKPADRTQMTRSPASPAQTEGTVSLSQISGEDEDAAAKRQAEKAQKKRADTSSFRLVEFNETETKTDAGAKPDAKVNLNFDSSQVVLATPGKTQKTGQTRLGGANAAAGNTAMLRRPPVAAETKKKPIGAIAVAAGLAIVAWYYSADLENASKTQSTRSAPAERATLQIQGNLKAATVSVNDNVVAQALPAQIKVPVGQPLRVVVTSNGYKRFAQEIQLGAGESKQIVAELVREDSSAAPTATVASVNPPGSAAQNQGAGNQATGIVRVNVLPVGIGTSVRIGGSIVDVSGVANIPVDTPLELIVERDGFRTHRQMVQLPAGRAAAGETVVDVKLEEAKFGYVSIKTTPSADAILTVDGVEEKWATPVSRKRLPVGTYKIRLVNSLLGMEKELSVTVTEDRFANIEERLTIAAEGQPSANPQRAPSQTR